MELVQAAMDGANREVEEGAEDRKGGASEVAKMFLSANDKQVAIIAHLPNSLKDKLGLKEWFDRVVSAMNDAEIISEDENYIKAIVKGNVELEKFPLKMRDAGINAGFALLHEKCTSGKSEGRGGSRRGPACPRVYPFSPRPSPRCPLQRIAQRSSPTTTRTTTSTTPRPPVSSGRR